MYLLNNDHPNQIEETTFAELGKKESYIEEILRKNVDMICDDAESMLIVGKQDITRRSLPKIDAMLSWGVKPEAELGAKGRADEAILLENGQVKVKSTGEVQSMQQWLKSVYGWSSVETYAFAVDKKSGKSLAEIRAEYMEKNQHWGEREL